MSQHDNDTPVALVTGGARRIGRCIVETLHGAGYRVMIHHRDSAEAAGALAERLNTQREDSAATVALDLVHEPVRSLVPATRECFGRLDLLVNNASSFYPTPVGRIDLAAWEDLMGSNARAPLFLSQAATPALRQTGGAIVNLIDIHARAPLAGHPVYVMAKAALDMMTRSLARELAPEVRVNGVAPGAILWPETASAEDREAVIAQTPLQRTGSPEDIAEAVLFLARAGFITGQVLAVDGGRSLRS